MKNKGDFSVRVSRKMVEQAEGLIAPLMGSPWGEAVRWNATTIIRLALAQGLERLEREYRGGDAALETVLEQ